jgi:hypothetical protein
MMAISFTGCPQPQSYQRQPRRIVNGMQPELTAGSGGAVAASLEARNKALVPALQSGTSEGLACCVTMEEGNSLHPML